jgi:hypothetical protein
VVVPVRIEVASRSSWSHLAVMCSVSMTPPTSGARLERRLLDRAASRACAFLDIANARSEAEAEEVAEAEHVITPGPMETPIAKTPSPTCSIGTPFVADKFPGLLDHQMREP